MNIACRCVEFSVSFFCSVFCCSCCSSHLVHVLACVHFFLFSNCSSAWVSAPLHLIGCCAVVVLKCGIALPRSRSRLTSRPMHGAFPVVKSEGSWTCACFIWCQHWHGDFGPSSKASFVVQWNLAWRSTLHCQVKVALRMGWFPLRVVFHLGLYCMLMSVQRSVQIFVTNTLPVNHSFYKIMIEKAFDFNHFCAHLTFIVCKSCWTHF